MSQLNNFLAAFPGHKGSPLYGAPLEYLPGVPRGYAPISAMHHVIGVSPGVTLVGDRKFSVLDPNGDIPDQLAYAVATGFAFVELGAPGGYGLGKFMDLLTHTHGLGIGVIAKNVASSVGPYQYISHPNVFGVVVERGAGSPHTYDQLRKDARKDGLMPVWFVFDGEAGADACAGEIRQFALKGMGVTYSAGLTGTRYDDSHGVLTPVI